MRPRYGKFDQTDRDPCPMVDAATHVLPEETEHTIKPEVVAHVPSRQSRLRAVAIVLDIVSEGLHRLIKLQRWIRVGLRDRAALPTEVAGRLLV